MTPSPPPSQPPYPLSTLVLDVANMLKSFIGVNIMYTSYAFSQAGLLRGVLSLLFIVLLTEHCCMILIHAKNSLPTPLPPTAHAADQPHPPISYPTIARLTHGQIGENVVTACILITQFGYCVSYLIFVTATLSSIFHPSALFIIFPPLILFPITLLSSIRSLAPLSLLANIALLSAFVTILLFLSSHFHYHPPHPSLLRYPLFFGQITAALEGIALVLPVEQSMLRRDKFPLVLRLALAILTVVLMSVGVLGSLTFGDHTSSIILLNFGPSSLVTAVKVMVVVGILFTYPVQIVPVLEAIDAKLAHLLEPINAHAFTDVTTPLAPPLPPSPSPPPPVETATPFQLADHHHHDYDDDNSSDNNNNNTCNHPASPPSFDLNPAANPCFPPSMPRTIFSAWFVTSKWRILARIIVVLITVIIAQFAANSFGVVQSLVGSVGASVLAYTAPALIANHVETDVWLRAKNWAIVAFGVVGGIVGTVVSVKDIVDNAERAAGRG